MLFSYFHYVESGVIIDINFAVHDSDFLEFSDCTSLKQCYQGGFTLYTCNLDKTKMAVVE